MENMSDEKTDKGLREEGVDDVLIALSNAAGEFGFTWDSKDHEGSAKRFLDGYCAYKDKRERGAK